MIKLETALEAANVVSELVTPYTMMDYLAGSCRRKQPMVKDIEIVAIPAMVKDDVSATLQRRLGAKKLKNGTKYKQFFLPKWNCNLDLFIIVKPAQLGVILALRTGPANFSKWLVSPKPYGALPYGYKVKDGCLRNKNNEIIETPTESSFFEAIGKTWIKPELRDAFIH